MHAFLICTLLVALAEIGDKTQLLAFVLAAKYKKPWPIIAGIFLATVFNHGLAGSLGLLLTRWLSPQLMSWILGLSFIGMAIWMLIPDKLDEEEQKSASNWGVFATTLVAFFLAEIGDKTQVATIALAAKYQQLFAVTLGTTCGMMLANVPAVIFGERIAKRMPTQLVHRICALIFAALGIFSLWFGYKAS